MLVIIYPISNQLSDDYKYIPQNINPYKNNKIISLYISIISSIISECRKLGNSKKLIDFVLSLLPDLLYIIDINENINKEILNLFKSTLFDDNLLFSYDISVKSNKKVKVNEKKESKKESSFLSHSNQLFDKILNLEIDSNSNKSFPQLIKLIFQAYIERINENNIKIENGISQKRKSSSNQADLQTSHSFAFFVKLYSILITKINKDNNYNHYIIWKSIEYLINGLYIHNIYTLNEVNEYELSKLRQCRDDYLTYLQTVKPETDHLLLSLLCQLNYQIYEEKRNEWNKYFWKYNNSDNIIIVLDVFGKLRRFPDMISFLYEASLTNSLSILYTSNDIKKVMKKIIREISPNQIPLLFDKGLEVLINSISNKNFSSIKDMTEIYLLIMENVLITEHNCRNILSKIDLLYEKVISVNFNISSANIMKLKKESDEYNLVFMNLYLITGIHSLKNKIQIYTGFPYKQSIPSNSELYKISENINFYDLCLTFRDYNQFIVLTLLLQGIEFLNHFTYSIADIPEKIHKKSIKEAKKLSSQIISVYINEV